VYISHENVLVRVDSHSGEVVNSRWETFIFCSLFNERFTGMNRSPIDSGIISYNVAYDTNARVTHNATWVSQTRTQQSSCVISVGYSKRKNTMLSIARAVSAERHVAAATVSDFNFTRY
jgi:hypothetical protein